MSFGQTDSVSREKELAAADRPTFSTPARKVGRPSRKRRHLLVSILQSVYSLALTRRIYFQEESRRTGYTGRLVGTQNIAVQIINRHVFVVVFFPPQHKHFLTLVDDDSVFSKKK